MCQWRTLYYIDCKHYDEHPIPCTKAKELEALCQGWRRPRNKCDSVTGNGATYTPAMKSSCPDCRHLAKEDVQRGKDAADKRDSRQGALGNKREGAKE